jgi:NAD(P)-dependent dehydrogenase (short-subunit alcohol dehydrogenase family)
MKLENKTAVITGGNSGIGLAIAQEFKAQGARIALTGRRAEVTAAAAKLVGDGTLGIVGDVASLSDLDKLFATVREQLGEIDVLVVNAGQSFVTPLAAMDEATYDRMMNTNAKGTYFTVQKALPHLRDGASIVLTGSIASHTGTAGLSVYCASKAAVRSMARTFASELAPRGIRVNVLCPGPTDTPIFGKMGFDEEQEKGFKSYVTGQVPLGRFGTPAELAKVALFLASDDSSFITGVDLQVDGGMTQV